MSYVPLCLFPDCAKSLSHVRLFVTSWAITHQVPLSMGFSRQEYWSGLPCFPPGDLADPRIERVSLLSPAVAGRFLTTSATWEDPLPGGGGNMPEELGAGRRSLTGHLKLVSLPEPVQHFLTLTVSAGPPETTQREAYLTQSLTHIRNRALPTLPASSPGVLSSTPLLSLMKGRQAEGIWWESGRLCSLYKFKLQAIRITLICLSQVG